MLVPHYQAHHKVIDRYLPYSIGIEIECDQNDQYTKEFFTRIPYIMAVESDSNEQRYRIPNGLRGLVCLYLLSLTCKQQLLLNLGSGIHYHCDLTDCYHQFYKSVTTQDEQYMLSELDKWDYKGTYNTRGSSKSVGGFPWIRFQEGFKTMEIRIGEMTFEYEILIERIRSICKMVNTIKTGHNIPINHIYKPVDSLTITTFLEGSIHITDAKLRQTMGRLEDARAKLIEQRDKITPQVEEQYISKSRVVKLY